MKVKPEKSIASLLHDRLQDMKNHFDEHEAVYLLTLWGHSWEEAERMVRKADLEDASEAE